MVFLKLSSHSLYILRTLHEPSKQRVHLLLFPLKLRTTLMKVDPLPTLAQDLSPSHRQLPVLLLLTTWTTANIQQICTKRKALRQWTRTSLMTTLIQVPTAQVPFLMPSFEVCSVGIARSEIISATPLPQWKEAVSVVALLDQLQALLRQLQQQQHILQLYPLQLVELVVVLVQCSMGSVVV